MTTETQEQRRTRLIEQYVGQLHPHICNCDATIDDATRLADAVIAATPQEPLPKHTKAHITLLRELIKDMLRDMSHGDCSLFLAHDSRFEEICDGLAPDPQEPEPNLEQQLKTARLEVEAEMLRCAKPTRYPSEIETRLIELLTAILFDSQVWERFPSSQAQLQSEFAAIKRDLGLV